jgi:ABC-type Fe3+ transport system permease subunit
MEPNYQQQPDIFNEQRPLPNATATLVLGILSIVVCFICGIIALIISSPDKRMYHENPNLYSASSYETLRAGRICAIIGLCLVGVVIFIFVMIAIFAASFATLSH